jgi:arylsulfatase A-like enzyme
MNDFSMFKPGSNPGDPPIYDTTGYYPLQTLPEFVRMQNRTICALDEGVGQIMKALEETGQLDNTLVVYGTDNGFPWGEQGFANKNGPYDACCHTPLIVRWPREFARGAVCKHPVSQLDLIPTFFALAGVALPWEMHGHDLRGVLKDPASAWPYPVMIEHLSGYGSQTDNIRPRVSKTERNGADGGPRAFWLSLHEEHYHYIRWIATDEIEELYDLEADPAELRNLAVLPQQRQTLETYRGRLEAELKRTQAGLVDNLPPPRVRAEAGAR